MYIAPQIVIGFHGCSQSVADRVIKNGGGLSNSNNDYDWLGNGIYFWEGSYQRALDWAKQNTRITQPAVVGAFIKLGNCLDLLDSKYLEEVAATYAVLHTESLHRALPQNTVYANDISFFRALDCTVITRLHQTNNQLIAEKSGLSSISGQDQQIIQNHPDFYDTVRGMFPEGQPLYQGAGFRDKKSHPAVYYQPQCDHRLF